MRSKGVVTATNAIEEQIVSAATAGDTAAFTQLAERYRGELQAVPAFESDGR